MTITAHDPEVMGGLHLPISPGPKGFDVQICLCYTIKILLRGGGPIGLALQDLQLDDIRTAEGSLEDSRMLHRSILSLAIIFFGSQHMDSSITQRGYVIHGLVLKQLNHALLDARCYARDDVILSVVTLALLECFVPTGRKYYLKHMLGLEMLLELRGPTTDCSPNSIQIYKSVRRMILFASLNARKPSILARKEWKSVLQTDCRGQELEEQYLFDALADCTVLVAECDKVTGTWMEGSHSATHQQYQLIQRSLDLLEQLKDWRARWGCKTTTVTDGAQGLGDCEDSVTPFPKNLKGSAIILLMLYNTIIIFISRILSSFISEYRCSSVNQFFTESLLDGPEPLQSFEAGLEYTYAAAERNAALEIYHCIPHVRKSHLDSGSLTVAHLAFRTAWGTLGGNDSREGQSLTDYLKTGSHEVFAKGLWVD